MRNNERNEETLSEDSETDSDFKGERKDNSTIVNAGVPAIADPLKARRVRDKRGSKDAGKFSTYPKRDKKIIRSFFFFNKGAKKSFSFNCFSRDSSESPDDVTESVVH